MPDGALAGGAADDVNDIVRGHARGFIQDQETVHRLPDYAVCICGNLAVAPLRRTRERNSLRVCSWVLKTPRIAEVTVAECCFSTPRIIMQRCCASRMTATPCGSMASVMASAICGGEALLHLQAAGEDIDHAGNLGEADDLAIGDIGDVGLAEEGQQMVLAHGEELDVLDDDHLVVVDVEERVVQDCR